MITSWPDLTRSNLFSAKYAQKTPHKLWKISARYSKRFGVQLTRALGGVWTSPPPSGFLRLAKTRRRCAPPGFYPPYPHLFRNFCENFDPMPCKVRSSGQVKWPNYKITFQSRHGYNVSGKVMKLSEYVEFISAYKTYISDFWYRWPQVRSFLQPPH